MLYIWVAIIVLLTIVELMTVNLTTIWFVVSAIVSLILSFFTDNFLIQFGVFAVLGSILLATTRPVLKKMLCKGNVPTNADRIINMKGIVTEEIIKNKTGEVKVDGKKWTAYADKKIDIDSIVKILEIDGVKLKVEKMEE